MSERLLDSSTITEISTEPQKVDPIASLVPEITTNDSFMTSFERMLEAERLSVESHLTRLNGNGHEKPKAKKTETKKAHYKAVDMGVIFTAETHEEQTQREELSSELLWLTKVDINNSEYAQAKKEYQEISPTGRFKDWDFKTYTVFYMTRIGNENRNSVRNNWEADVKAEHKALYYTKTNDMPSKERPKYDELEADKMINREGM